MSARQEVCVSLSIPPEVESTSGVKTPCSISSTRWPYCSFLFIFTLLVHGRQSFRVVARLIGVEYPLDRRKHPGKNSRRVFQ